MIIKGIVAIAILGMYAIAGTSDYNYQYGSETDCSSALECQEKYGAGSSSYHKVECILDGTVLEFEVIISNDADVPQESKEFCDSLGIIEIAKIKVDKRKKLLLETSQHL